MFDRDALIAACRAEGRVVRVVVASVQGSAPREVGAAMLVWGTGQSGTIGGGALEYEVARASRRLAQDALSRHALGPAFGQCCGGAVEILSEVYDLSRAEAVPLDVIARGPGTMPLSVKRALKTGQVNSARMLEGWMIEPVKPQDRDIWIWGAGHVGRALVDLMQHLPGHAVTWVDTASNRFPEKIPTGVTDIASADPTRLMPHAPREADHLILTYAHDLDLALCHAALTHGFGTCGLIGSATKWARFRKRLAALGHSEADIARITCPIGNPSLGKHPHLIALGVTHELAHTRFGSAERSEIRA